MEKIEFLKNIKGPEQKSEDWLNLRNKYLTTSTFGSIFGTNKYQTAEDILIEKCLPPGKTKKFSGSEATYFGERYETEAADLYCKLMNKTNYEFGLIPWTEVDPIRSSSGITDFLNDNQHIDTSILACSPDGISIDNDGLEDPVLLEIKCPFKRKIVHGEVPESYLSQVQFNMHILDLTKADFVEYSPPGHNGNEDCILNIVRVHRDDDYFKKNILVLNEFWEKIIHWRKVGIHNHPHYSKYFST